MNRRFHLILNFLLRNNKLRTFLLFFFISFLLWLGVQLNRKYIYEFKIPVVYTNLPTSYYKGFLPNDTLNVKVKMTGYQILKNKLLKPHLLLDVQKYNIVKHKQWHPDDFLNQINNLIGNNNQIINISPRTVSFNLTSVHKKQVPVIADVSLKFRPGFGPKSKPQLQPDSVWIFGDQPIIDTIKFVKTRHYDINNIDKNVNKSLVIKTKEGVKFNVSNIKYQLPVSEIVEDEVRLPIQIKGKPEGVRLLLFPEKIKLKYKFFKENVNLVNMDHVKAVVDYKPDQKTWKVSLNHKPPGIFDLQLLPGEITYLIQKTND